VNRRGFESGVRYIANPTIAEALFSYWRAVRPPTLIARLVGFRDPDPCHSVRWAAHESGGFSLRSSLRPEDKAARPRDFRRRARVFQIPVCTMRPLTAGIRHTEASVGERSAFASPRPNKPHGAKRGLLKKQLADGHAKGDRQNFGLPSADGAHRGNRTPAVRWTHYALYEQCRERAQREASPTAAIIDCQSVKSANTRHHLHSPPKAAVCAISTYAHQPS
jgi:hypothetical protein